MLSNRIKRTKQQGDTIIEVLFAITVFSLVAVGSLSIMNAGSSTAERSLEISLVREQMDGQAEALRFLNASYVAAYQPGITYAASTPAGQWSLIDKNIPSGTNVTSFAATNGTCPAAPIGSFVVNPDTSQYVALSTSNTTAPSTYAQLGTTTINGVTSFQAQGIWIQGVSSPKSADGSNTGYIDFHINACWASPGQSAPVTIATIVRLYEPKG